MARKGCWVGLGLIVAAGVGFLLSGPGQAIADIWRTGAVQDALNKEERVYSASTEENLKALHTALSLYHDSEGQFPRADRWMDAILPRLRTGDLKEGEEMKKLVRPKFLNENDRFGYAMNEKASDAYQGDLDPKLPLIYESETNWKWNATGEPGSNGAGKYVAVDGTVGTLP